MADREMHLGAFMRPTTIHTGAWRYPGAWPDANFNLGHLTWAIRRLEAAKFDAFFMADHLAVLNMPIEALKRSHTVTSFDPLTLLPALAVQTERIGLIATASTTFEPPYTLARRFATLDHISGGRAAWNIVTTANPDAALNFGMTEQPGHAARYARAREYFDVVTGLWDSFADDAFPRDQESGLYFDPERMHVLDHQGPALSVRGPLNIARPPQGWPVIVQAGASEDGRQLAAETAEVVFASGGSLRRTKDFTGDVRARARAAGRPEGLPLILPGAFVVLGETDAEARAIHARLDGLVYWESAIAALSIALGVDARAFDPERPLPEDIPETNASKSGRERVLALARSGGLTVRELAQRLGGYAGLSFVGSPATVADRMEEYFLSGACDGFNILFSHLPGGLEAFCAGVIPELQRRGLFRRDYAGRTLRAHLGLPRPENRFFGR